MIKEKIMKPFSQQEIDLSDGYVFAEVDDIDDCFTTDKYRKGCIPAEKLFIGASIKSDSVLLLGMRKKEKTKNKYEMCFQIPLAMMYTKETVPDSSTFYKGSIYPKKVLTSLSKYAKELKVEFKKRMKDANINWE
jgi:hypothetical protein